MPEFRYDGGALIDRTDRRWHRIRDWVEPDEADALVRGGIALAVQWCRSAPSPGDAARFRRDVLRRMITRAQAQAYVGRSTVPTVVVVELWRSATAGDLLLGVERGPFPRSATELVDDV